jgi:uncharacterized protein YjbJ (UPF0337 family)
VNDKRNRQDPQEPYGHQYRPGSTKEHLRDRSSADQLRGILNQAGGKVRQAVGKMTGKKDLRREGRMQEIKGNLQKTAGKVERHLHDLLNH